MKKILSTLMAVVLIISALTICVSAATDIDLSKSYKKYFNNDRYTEEYDIGSIAPWDDVRVKTTAWAVNTGETGYASVWINAINGVTNNGYSSKPDTFLGDITTGWVGVASVDYAQNIEHSGAVYGASPSVPALFHEYY